MHQLLQLRPPPQPAWQSQRLVLPVHQGGGDLAEWPRCVHIRGASPRKKLDPGRAN
jgi:hypothetical protein